MELLDKILDDKNLFNAYKQVYKNKGTSGVDNITVEELGYYMYLHKEEIKEQIRNLKYKPSPVRRVEIPKENGKLRKLGIPTVVDRLIQQAMVQVLSPIFEQQFSNNSYGFRPKRCCEQAVIKALEYFNDGFDLIVDIDLQSFFDKVNQDKLIGIIRRTIKDGRVVSLIRKYLASGVMVNGVCQPTKIGTPQGGFGFYNKKGTWRPKPHLKSVQKFEKKLKEITSRSNAMSIAEKIVKLNQVIRGLDKLL